MLCKVLIENKEILKKANITKHEFDLSIIYTVYEALKYKYTVNGDN